MLILVALYDFLHDIHSHIGSLLGTCVVSVWGSFSVSVEKLAVDTFFLDLTVH